MAFQPVTTVKGTAVPLRRTNVDTDQIIPAVYMKRITRTGFEDGLFASWRKDPAFELNRPEHAGANILIAGPDFGTGSSREHAVWALMDYGFRVVISPRFADIFKGNAGKSGLLAIQLAPQHVEQLWETVETHPERPLNVDLNAQTISAGGLTINFSVDPDTRWRLLNGLDDIDLTLQHQDDITSFERTRQAWLPTTTPKQAYKTGHPK
ncbi:3-isopropylmalate dehydratase small subunit [Arthrobacter sp. NPDC080073]|uniref:3-isopropylmalate dehydratase small subunit n=1 Tax=Arthrobacter sp. NPDC080073 TaxID=3155919 RepID=UPI00342E18D1